jgi:hypothetical protein
MKSIFYFFFYSHKRSLLLFPYIYGCCAGYGIVGIMPNPPPRFCGGPNKLSFGPIDPEAPTTGTIPPMPTAGGLK